MVLSNLFPQLVKCGYYLSTDPKEAVLNQVKSCLGLIDDAVTEAEEVHIEN